MLKGINHSPTQLTVGMPHSGVIVTLGDIAYHFDTHGSPDLTGYELETVKGMLRGALAELESK